jgi:hypothetical protein
MMRPATKSPAAIIASRGVIGLSALCGQGARMHEPMYGGRCSELATTIEMAMTIEAGRQPSRP